MHFTSILLFATSALAAVSAMEKCAKEHAECQKSASALSLLSTCSLRLAGCNSAISINLLDGAEDNSDNTVSPAQKKAYRKCKKQFDNCRDVDGANLSTCASQIVTCVKTVKKEVE